jgi:chromosome segregation ATPase
MSALDAAQHHLNQALARLEQALAHRLAAVDPDQATVVAQLSEERAALARDVNNLRDECTRLGAALRNSQREHEALRRVTDGVAGRLDDSVAELNRLLGE